MESKTAKKKFCSDKCRIYYKRELENAKKKKEELLKYPRIPVGRFIDLEKLDENKPHTTIPETISNIRKEPLSPEECYTIDFGDDKWLQIEKYTQYPLKDTPTDRFKKIEWMREKRLSDEIIRAEWNRQKSNK